MSIPTATFPFTIVDNGTLWCCGMPGCTKQIPTAKKSLIVYHRNTHFPNYECEHCGEKFPQKNRLDVHIRTTHTGEKPYPCKHCDRAFPQLSNLQDHQRKHHGMVNSSAPKEDNEFAAFRAKEVKWIHLEHSDWTIQQIRTEVMHRWQLVNAVA
jgi:hypothetical protein